MLQGKKTFIVATGMLAYGITLILQGQQETGIAMIMNGLGFAGLRVGVGNGKTPPIQ